jgi:hypothetical protein
MGQCTAMERERRVQHSPCSRFITQVLEQRGPLPRLNANARSGLRLSASFDELGVIGCMLHGLTVSRTRGGFCAQVDRLVWTSRGAVPDIVQQGAAVQSCRGVRHDRGAPPRGGERVGRI